MFELKKIDEIIDLAYSTKSVGNSKNQAKGNDAIITKKIIGRIRRTLRSQKFKKLNFPVFSNSLIIILEIKKPEITKQEALKLLINGNYIKNYISPSKRDEILKKNINLQIKIKN